MAKVIVGRFTTKDLAARAADEVKARQLSLFEPQVIETKIPDLDVITQESSNLLSEQGQIDKLAMFLALALWCLGVLAMIVIGQAGSAVVHLPVFFALWGVASVIGVRELLSINRVGKKTLVRATTEVRVTTREPEVVEQIFENSGADEVSIKAA